MQVFRNVSSVTLNAVGLSVKSVYYEDATGTKQDCINTHFNEMDETVLFSFNNSLSPGFGKLCISFQGVIHDDVKGFYKRENTYATCFEPCFARFGKYDTQKTRIDINPNLYCIHIRTGFFCWDDPGFKATFDISLMIPEGTTAISNAVSDYNFIII